MGAQILTNDFNLNKVCDLHHVQVLNINDLANAVKPVVIPERICKSLSSKMEKNKIKVLPI